MSFGQEFWVVTLETRAFGFSKRDGCATLIEHAGAGQPNTCMLKTRGSFLCPGWSIGGSRIANILVPATSMKVYSSSPKNCQSMVPYSQYCYGIVYL